MWFRHRAWVPTAWLLSVANVASIWFAVRPFQPLHAGIHAALAVVFALAARGLARRHRDLVST